MKLIGLMAIIDLQNKRIPTVEDKHLLSYMGNGLAKDREAASAVSVALDDA